MNSLLPAYECTVRDEWIDYNGHMSEAFYVLAFGFATDQVMDHLGMGASYREDTSCSLYTVEAHIRYLDETSLGDQLSVTTTIVDAGTKKLHLAHEMRVDEQLVSTEEVLALHVDAGAGRVADFPEHVRSAVEKYRLAREAENPDWIGRKVGL